MAHANFFCFNALVDHLLFLSADPEAVARWLLYTSDGTHVCVLRKSGKGKHAWHDHDAKRGWTDSRGFNPFGLAAAQRAYPALLGLAPEHQNYLH